MTEKNSLFDINYLENSAKRLKALKEESYTPFLSLKDGVIADIGCGTGMDVLNLAAITKGNGIKVIGVDFQEEMIAQANSNLKDNADIEYMVGDTENLPKEVYNELQQVIEDTKNNTKGVLTLALSYGAKDEIIQAVKSIAQDVKNDDLEINNITPEVFKNYLFTADLPDVDLLIRTSGETRISNFLLWQIAYAELYFTDILWPDFRKEDLFNAIYSYQKRERRFGKTGEQLTEPKN